MFLQDVSDVETGKNRKRKNRDQSDSEQEKPLSMLFRQSSEQLTDVSTTAKY